MAFADELATRYPDRVRILPADSAPRPELPALLGALPSGCAVYCCGPEALMDAVADEMTTACPQGSLHLERFAATVKDDSENRPFQVVLPRAGAVLDVPADRPPRRGLMRRGPAGRLGDYSPAADSIHRWATTAGYRRVLVLAALDEPVVHQQLAGLGRAELIQPDEAALAAFGTDPLNPSTRTPAAEAGRAQGIVEAARIADLWHD